MLVRYTGPHPRVDVPALDITVDRDTTITVPDDTVLGSDWTVPGTDPASMTAADLRAALGAAGIDPPKGAKRADLLALLTASEEDDR